MPLKSDLFTKPETNQKLEDCLVKDSAHVTKGARGDHVGLIQQCLTILGEGVIAPDEVRFKTYGTTTARAVLAFKTKRGIINRSYQDTPDDIVGKMTIERLDAEIDILEDLRPKEPQLIAADFIGHPQHDHRRCPLPSVDKEIEIAPDKTMSHFATPMNILGFGRKICIGGKFEVAYLGFEDFVPDPQQDPDMGIAFVNGRRFTREITRNSVSDICFRSTPLDKFMKEEIRRICMMGARLTFASDSSNVISLLPYFGTLGPIIARGTIKEPVGTASRDFAVVGVLNVNLS